MEAQSVSPSVTPSLEVTKDEQEASNNQSATENTLQSEDSLQEVPEKKQKVSRVIIIEHRFLPLLLSGLIKKPKLNIYLCIYVSF